MLIWCSIDLTCTGYVYDILRYHMYIYRGLSPLTGDILVRTNEVCRSLYNGQFRRDTNEVDYFGSWIYQNKGSITFSVSAYLRSRIRSCPHSMRFLGEYVICITYAFVFCTNWMWITCFMLISLYQYVIGKWSPRLFHDTLLYWHENKVVFFLQFRLYYLNFHTDLLIYDIYVVILSNANGIKTWFHLFLVPYTSLPNMCIGKLLKWENHIWVIQLCVSRVKWPICKIYGGQDSKCAHRISEFTTKYMFLLKLNGVL